jgi:hypothetical protein
MRLNEKPKPRMRIGAKSAVRGLREVTSAPTRRTVREAALVYETGYMTRQVRTLKGRKLWVKGAFQSAAPPEPSPRCPYNRPPCWHRR